MAVAEISSVRDASPTPKGPAPILEYGALQHCHREHDARLFEKLEDLYEAGWALLQKARRYLPQSNFEANTSYDYRCQVASCLPYFAQIVDQFSSDLFSQPITTTPAGDAENPNTPGEMPDAEAEEYYSDFAKDADGGGLSLSEILSGAVKTSLKMRRAYLFIDAPESDGPEPANRAEEDEAGLRRCYVYELPPSQLIDWKLDKKGEYEWLVTRTVDEDSLEPATARTKVRECFTIWRRGEGDSGASWARYVAEYDPREPPNEKTKVPLDDFGETAFPRIPILKLELSKGLWIGNKIGTQQLEHWRRRSELIGSESRSCHAVPTVFLGPEMSAAGFNVPGEVQQNPNRGMNPVGDFRKRGNVRLGHEDRFEFVEPAGHSYALIDKELESLKDEMFRVVHMMAASVKNTPGSLGRSGMSKQKDGEATVRVLNALGEKVRGLVRRLYDTISKARGEDIVWVVHGLDSYEMDDREQVLEESLELQMVDIPSPTFKKEHAKYMSRKLVRHLPPATVAQIDKEIDEGVEDIEEIKGIERDVHKDELLNPAPPPAPVVGQPPAPKPGAPKPSVEQAPAPNKPKPPGGEK